ncbi:hypothetical protein BJ944DRAFT_244537 [Cunninghamella echinulata]|nr:hypothetical protein BJ944DRAFT_244537 [Cunninghamella echinulata]
MATLTVLPDTGHHQASASASTHDKKKCTSASCCSPSRLWKSIQQFIHQQDDQAFMNLCQDEEKKGHVLRVLLTSRYHNDPARYGASNKHLVLQLSDCMVPTTEMDGNGSHQQLNSALYHSNNIKRRKLVYEKFGKSLTDLNALQLAILYRQEEMICYLLDHVSTYASSKEFHSFLHHQCGKQISSLHLAAFLGLPKVVDKLLNFGLSPNLKNDRLKTPLDCTDHVECRQLLELALKPAPAPAPVIVSSKDEAVKENVEDNLILTTTAVDEGKKATAITIIDHPSPLCHTIMDRQAMNSPPPQKGNNMLDKATFVSPLGVATKQLSTPVLDLGWVIDLNDTWIMDAWDCDNHPSLSLIPDSSLSGSKQSDSHSSLSPLQPQQSLLYDHGTPPHSSSLQPQQPVFDLNHHDELGTPPLSPVQDDDDNDSITMDELPELDLELDNNSNGDHGGEMTLMPLLYDVNGLSSYIYQERKWSNDDSYVMKDDHDHGGGNDGNDSKAQHLQPLGLFSSHSPPSSLMDSSTFVFTDDNGNDSARPFSTASAIKKQDQAVDASPGDQALSSSASCGGGSDGKTLHPPFTSSPGLNDDHDPPNINNNADNSTQPRVHFDPKVILMEACIRGDLQELMDTLQSSKDLSWLFNHHGYAGVHDRTLLQLALMNGHENIVHYLVNQIKVNVNQVDADGWTALHYAAALGRWKVAEYLASLNITDLFAQTDDGYLYEDCTGSRLNRIRCQWLLDRAMMNHSLYSSPHYSTSSTSISSTITAASSASPLMCGGYT